MPYCFSLSLAYLQVVRREGDWLQVSDPVTQERGWVLEKYLVATDGPSRS